jgi:hypothetical protein
MSSTAIPPSLSIPKRTVETGSHLPARKKDRTEVWLTGAVMSLGGLYLLQLVAPLRIDNDSVAYLVAAIELADHGLPSTSSLPVGYPALVAVLIRAGLASAQSLMMVNLLSIAAAMGALWWIARDRPRPIRLAAVAMSLLSYPILRSAIMAQPDALALALILGAVAVTTSITSARTLKNLSLMMVAGALTAAACATRMAAVVLVLPLLWCLLQIAAPGGDRRKQLWIAGGLVIASLLGLGVVIALSEAGTLARYQADAAKVLSHMGLQYPVDRVISMFFGMGEMTLNAPVTTLPDSVRVPLGIFGVIPLSLFLYTWRRSEWKPQVAIFAGAYLMMLAVWPFYVSRLFIPVIPLILLHFVTVVAATRNRRTSRLVGLGFIACFTVGGLLSLGWTTRVSLAGEHFRQVWGTNGGLASPGFEDSDHNRNAMIVLRRLDPHHAAWRRLLAGDTSKVVPKR